MKCINNQFPFAWTVIFLAIINWATCQNTNNRFCAALCTKDNCNGSTFESCTTCITGFTLISNICEINNSTGYKFYSSSDDVMSGSFSTTASLSQCGPQTVTGFSAGSYTYSYYGNVSGSTEISFEDSDTIDMPHYQLRIIFWIILIDDWYNTDTITVTLTDSNGFSEIKTTKRANSLTRRRTCGNSSDQEDYIRFDSIFTHNATDVNLKVSAVTNNTNSQAFWGIKELLVYPRVCHDYCIECYGSLSTVCWACETGYKLSNNTCNATCGAGFGITADDSLCIWCNLRCLVCENTADFCYSCRPSGTWKSFLNPNNTCTAECEIGMYGNTTDRVCYDCDTVACVSCTGTPNYCFECQPGYSFANYICYDDCPLGTFESNFTKNCTTCSPYCALCSINSTYCTLCTLTGTYKAFLNGTDCVRDCGPNFYESVETNAASVTENYCRSCDPGCYQCSNNPSPCTECNPQYWLFEDTCGQTCPNLYFEDNATWHCLLCETWCVGMNMKMYFSDSTNDRIYIDFTFTEDLDFTIFPYQTFQEISIDSSIYTLEMFKFSFQILSTKSYRVIMEPKGYLFLYNATITVKTMTKPTNEHLAINGRPFKETNYEVSKSLVWFLIKAPDMSNIEKSIINNLNNISDAVSSFTTLPYIQEIKKSGVLSMLFSGAQITSCSVLVNNIPSQNLYEGSRFWGMFVMFDVPKWEQNSERTKFAIVSPTSEVVRNARLLEIEKRALFDTNQVEWRFSRTGNTSFFIFDVYPALIMILICWILVAVGYCLNKRGSTVFKKHMGKFFSLLHKAHEVSLMYIMLSTIMEWFYFESTSVERWISLVICILVNFYILIYQMYVYYDMIKYPVAVIGTEKYDYFTVRYGSLLKNIRFEEYDIKEPWSPKQWFRPYNYHILSFVKKILMIISLPIFYNIVHAQASVLIIIQLLEIARFCYVWPFYKKWRNVYRLVLECALEMFFICILIQGFLVREIMINNEATLEKSIQLFYRFGWVGFSLVFFFNFGFVALMILDIVWGCKKTNQQMMDEARRVYYYERLQRYETEHENVPIGVINKWVKLGNLNERNYDDLPDVDVRIEYFKIAKLNDSYEVEIKKLVDLFMCIEFNFGEINNVDSGRKISKRISLTPKLSKSFYLLVDSLYQKYSHYNIEYITIKTFQFVDQSLLKPGEKIPHERSKMSQTIEIQTHSGHKKEEKLNKMMDGFPLSLDTLEAILSC